MSLDSVWPASWPSPWAWRGALAALAAALAWALLLRLMNRRDLATLGTALGLAVGWWFTLGLPIASPRQLAERLPLLALAGFAAALLLGLVAAGRRWGSALGAALLLAAGAWWLAGAPLAAADLRRAQVLLLALGAASAVASLELRSPLRAAIAFALLLAAVWIVRPTGPWAVLAAAGAAAALGGMPAGAPWSVTAALPVALALAGLAAGPILARGAAPDWTAGAAPFAALALGPALAARVGGGAGPAVGWAAAGGVPLLITWLLARNP
jgi:signal transduction histidine kinase